MHERFWQPGWAFNWLIPISKKRLWGGEGGSQIRGGENAESDGAVYGWYVGGRTGSDLVGGWRRRWRVGGWLLDE